MTMQQPDLTAVWAETQARLPKGWRLDSLRCASTGLTAEQRSDDWRALAVAPDGSIREARGADPVAALRALVDHPGDRELPGSPSHDR
jgi:hypothetical protein